MEVWFSETKIMFCSFDQMVVHARSGGTIEVMGLMQGKTDGDTIIIMDAFALPVEGTETRVNAQADAYEYMVQYSQTNKQVLFLSPPTMPVIVIWTIWSVFLVLPALIGSDTIALAHIVISSRC